MVEIEMVCFWLFQETRFRRESAGLPCSERSLRRSESCSLILDLAIEPEQPQGSADWQCRCKAATPAEWWQNQRWVWFGSKVGGGT
jgi:hypothetical protein